MAKNKNTSTAAPKVKKSAKKTNSEKLGKVKLTDKKKAALKNAVKKAAAKNAVKKAAVKKAIKKAVVKAAIKRAIVRKAVKDAVAKGSIKKTAAKDALKKVAAKTAIKKAALRQAVKKAVVKNALKKRVIKSSLAEKKLKKPLTGSSAKGKTTPKHLQKPEQSSTSRVVVVTTHKPGHASKASSKKGSAPEVVTKSFTVPFRPAVHKTAMPDRIAKRKKFAKNKKVKYSVSELKHFRKIIVDEQRAILESQRANMESLVDKESGEYKGDNLTYASHMAEQGSDEMEREKNYMFVQRDEKYLGYLQDALMRIDQGTYGICIDCKDEPKNLCRTCPLIPKERLEVVPITTHCIECKNLRSS